MKKHHPVMFAAMTLISAPIVNATNFSLSFDGVDDYVEVADSPELSGMSQLTVETWVKKPTGSAGTGMMITKWGNDSDHSSKSFHLYEVDDADLISFAVWGESTWDGVVFSSMDISADTWHLISGTYDGTELKLYLDGELKNSVSFADGAIQSTTTNLAFGAINRGSGYVSFFEGQMDEIRVWNRALTQTEIQSRMSKTLTPSEEAGLVGYWQFNEGLGNSTGDATASGNDGAIYSASWTTGVQLTGNIFVEEHNLSFEEHSSIETSILGEGKEYYLRISGTYSYSVDNLLDAAFRIKDRGQLLDPPEAARAWTWNGIASQRPTPDEYNEDHIYYFYFTGSGSGEEFEFSDAGGYLDNSGSLKIQIWQIATSITANFSADSNSGYVPLTVRFTDQSVVENTTISFWQWDLNGDGGIDSEEQHPSWIYDEIGTYTVSLQVSDGVDTASLTKEDYIVVLPHPEPVIHSIEDIPEDQGGYVGIIMAGSAYDCCETGYEISHYTVWREMDLNAVNGLLSGRRYILQTRYLLMDSTYWEYVGEFPAVGFEHYAYISPTIQDSSSAGVHWNTYVVIAHADSPDTLFVSRPDSGYSVDNLAPQAPGGVVASMGDQGIDLSWEMVPDEDFNYYAVYRSNVGGFDPSVEDVYKSTIDTFLVDTDVHTNLIYFYRVSAFDFAGNEGSYSQEVSASTMKVQEVTELPTVFSIAQNHPNPFNPFTKLPYGLPGRSHVVLTIYDILGRPIKTLVRGVEEPGFKFATWDGTNDLGENVSAGVYLYQIRAGEFIQTRKMVLLK